MRLYRIAFALSSRIKAERLDDSAPFILTSLPARVPALYPTRIPMKPINKSLSSFARSTSSLTRLERATKPWFETPGCARTRGKRVKRIPFFRCNTSSTLNLRISSGSDLTPSPECLIDEAVRSLRTALTPADAKRETPKGRLSRQIRHLRSKFDSVGEEHRAAESDRDSDADSIRFPVVNLKTERNLKEAKTTGGLMAALLIGSIHSMPLEKTELAECTPIPRSDQVSNDEASSEVADGEKILKEKSRENAEEESNEVKDEGQRRNASSLVDETEMSSFDDNSTGNESSDDTASYNILDDSRYSVERDSDETSDCQETIPIARSSAESCTESTLQVDSDAATNRLSPAADSASGTVEPRNDVIPIITVDAHESTDSDTSVDAFALSNDEERSDIATSRSPAESNTLVSQSSQSSADNREINDAGKTSDTSGKCQTLSLQKEKRHSGAEPDDAFREVHRVHLTRHERDLCRARRQSAHQREERSPSVAEAEERDATDAPELSGSTARASASNDELGARATIARRRCMHDLIRLIDTKLMSSTHHGKKITSPKSKRRRREKKACRVPAESLDKFPTRRTSRRRASHRRRKDVVSRVPRVHSTPENLFSGEHPIFYAASRSCGSSLVNLTDRTRVASSKRAASPADRPLDGSPRSDRGKLDAIAAVELEGDSIHVAAPTDHHHHHHHHHHPSCDTMTVAIRKCNSVCNLGIASCHIDCTKPTNTANMTYNMCVSRPSPNLRQQDEASVSPSCPLPTVPSVAAQKMSQSPATRTLASVPLHRRSSDSDLSVTPKGNSLGSSDRSMAGPLRAPAAVVRPMNQDTLEMLEYPFITMQHYPPDFILHIGGLVSSRSVKLLERISNLEEPEGRDAWWTEIRMEVRSHARALACNVVIGYKEETSICDDVCVLSASGTAAIINLHNSGQDPDGIVLNKLQQNVPAAAVDSDREKSQQKSTATKVEKVDGDAPIMPHSERQSAKACRHSSDSNDHEGSCGQSQLRCNLCHLPYSENSVPFRVNVSKCAICKRAKVPDVMFTTIEVPANIPTTGRGCFIQATVCKSKKDLRGELNAKEISDCLPFLEYELHSLLLNKLRIKGMNAIFGLRLQVSVGERFIIGMAVGTAIYLTALPPPNIPQIASGNSWHNEEQLAEMQKSIVDTVKKNREFYHLKPIVANEVENGRVPSTSDTDESDEDLPELDLGLGTRDACVLEVDDIEDMDRISSLMDNRPPDDFHVVNTQTIPGLEDLEIVRNLQMFTQVSRAKIPTGQFATMPSKYFARLLQSLYFKLRRMVPCALCDMQFKVALPEQDEIQLTVVGMALGLGEPLNTNKYKRKIVCRSLSKDQVRKSDDNDMIFSLDEDHLENNVASENVTRTCIGNPTTLSSAPVQKPRPRSPQRLKSFTIHRRKHVPLKARYGVDITPLSYLPGGRIERYQGNLNFFFIRESTSIRENGGLSGFTHSFVMEVLAIVRAHITALGGNAMVAFFMTQCVLLHNPHKSQGQCLINVGGDVVTVSYYADEKHNAVSNC